MRKLYHIDEIQSTIELIACSGSQCTLPPDGNLYPVKITAKRKFALGYPSGKDVRYSRKLGCGNYEGPLIDNGDGTYIRYLRAPTSECSTTIEGWVNEFKIESCVDITFKDCLSELGDVNLNGAINSMDASYILQCTLVYAQIFPLTLKPVASPTPTALEIQSSKVILYVS